MKNAYARQATLSLIVTPPLVIPTGAKRSGGTCGSTGFSWKLARCYSELSAHKREAPITPGTALRKALTRYCPGPGCRPTAVATNVTNSAPSPTSAASRWQVPSPPPGPLVFDFSGIEQIAKIGIGHRRGKIVFRRPANGNHGIQGIGRNRSGQLRGGDFFDPEVQRPCPPQ